MKGLACCLAPLVALAAAADPGYGPEPWLSGNPVANTGSVVVSARGTARFTVLTDALVRMEWTEGGGQWEDGRTLVVWNRELSVPSFAVDVSGNTTTITTSALRLTHSDDGAQFSDANLQVELFTPAFSPNATRVWTPSLNVSTDPGQLFGTFHTLDDGFQPSSAGLNCSLLDPNNDSGGAADFFPCDFGLLSTSGWSVVDDSRSPIWDDASGWLQTQDKAQCAPDDSAATPCFPGGQDTRDAALCNAAGCCSSTLPVPLDLCATRDDHFVDSLNCTGGCGGNGSVFEHADGFALSSPGTGLVALNLYWNPAPGTKPRGTGGDNVASSFPPTQPGYTLARVEGFIYDPALPQPPGTLPLKVYYSAVHLDHWTTGSAADEAAAIAAGYSLVGLAGYALSTAPSSNGTLSCYAPTGHQDWYLFAHGTNYSGALADYTSIAGSVPIPRRHWMGISWSKWNESEIQADAEAHVSELQAAGFPLDTLIFDMQWHLTPDWTGYTWDSSRYPNATAMLAWMHVQSLATGANLHDAQGVQSFEMRYAAMAAANGIDPATGQTVAFEIGNKTYADSLQATVLAPLIAQGLDLAWTDWQQGFPGVSSVRGLVPTAMLNHYRFHNFSVAPGVRGTEHSRYAGRGDHRHTSHFGGDIDQTWPSLQWMVYFTATAANAPACWWGHELMRNGGGVSDNVELFTRVIQFGAWSPTFTTWGNGGSNNDLWAMPEPYLTAARTQMLWRQRLLPYRYTAAATAHVTGVCPLTPMYFGWPDQPGAYSAPGQYRMGPDLIVAPAAAPVSGPSDTLDVSVWLPSGTSWVDFRNASAPAVPGGGVVTRAYGLAETPVWVRAGAVLPLLPAALAPVTGVSARQYDALEFSVYPGAPSGGVDVYEDDGISTAYLSGAFATTSLSYSPVPAKPSCTEFGISTAGAGYAGMVTTRNYTVGVLQSCSAGTPPSSVTANGAALPEAGSDGVPGTWFFTGADARVTLQPCDASAAQSVVVCCD